MIKCKTACIGIRYTFSSCIASDRVLEFKASHLFLPKETDANMVAIDYRNQDFFKTGKH